jgi:hypothetical protein
MPQEPNLVAIDVNKVEEARIILRAIRLSETWNRMYLNDRDRLMRAEALLYSALTGRPIGVGI